MSTALEVAVAISAIDRLTAPMRRMGEQVGAFQSRLEAMTNKVERLSATMDRMASHSEKFGTTFATLGASLSFGLHKSIKAFAEQEDAALRLKSALMDKDGVAGGFENIKKLAIDLGSSLPGTTAEYMQLVTQLHNKGLDNNAILGGAGRAAAYYAVATKSDKHASADLIAESEHSFGIGGEDTVKFVDLLQRLYHLGADTQYMSSAISHLGAGVKISGMQGFAAAKELTSVIALFNQMGVNPELAGSNISRFLTQMVNPNDTRTIAEMSEKYGLKPMDFVTKDKDGRETVTLDTIKNFAKQLEKYDGKALSEIMQAYFGKGEDGNQMILLVKAINEGKLAQIEKARDKQAALEQRIDVILKSLTNAMETAMGNWENAFAAMIEPISPTIKELVTSFGNLANNVQKFADENKTATAVMGSMALKITGASLALGGFGLVAAGGLKLSSTFLTLGQTIGNARRWMTGEMTKSQAKAANQVAQAQKVFVTNWPGKFGRGMTGQDMADHDLVNNKGEAEGGKNSWLRRNSWNLMAGAAGMGVAGYGIAEALNAKMPAAKKIDAVVDSFENGLLTSVALLGPWGFAIAAATTGVEGFIKALTGKTLAGWGVEVGRGIINGVDVVANSVDGFAKGDAMSSLVINGVPSFGSEYNNAAPVTSAELSRRLATFANYTASRQKSDASKIDVRVDMHDHRTLVKITHNGETVKTIEQNRGTSQLNYGGAH